MQASKEMALAPEQKEEFFQKALELTYHIVTDSYDKFALFFQAELKVSSVLLLVDILENSDWGSNGPSKQRFPCPKKGKECNNLLLLETDSSWNSGALIWEGKKYKTFVDWGTFAVHVSDMLVFRPSFFAKYSEDLFNEKVCYDKNIQKYEDLEYWQLKKKRNLS